MKPMIIAIFLTVALSSCEYLPESLKSIIGIKKEIVEPVRKKGIVLIADGTYSGLSTYKVPTLTCGLTKQIIEGLRTHGGGIVWVSYIDNNSNDNEMLQMEVKPARLCPTPSPTVQKSGYVNFPKEKAKWEQIHQQEIDDSIADDKRFYELKGQFIDEVNRLLSSKVYVQSTRNKWSDVNGTILSAKVILNNALSSGRIDDPIIVGFSDFEHDAMVNVSIEPDNRIKVYNLISQPGKSKRTIVESVELITENDVLNAIHF